MVWLSCWSCFWVFRILPSFGRLSTLKELPLRSSFPRLLALWMGLSWILLSGRKIFSGEVSQKMGQKAGQKIGKNTAMTLERFLLFFIPGFIFLFCWVPAGDALYHHGHFNVMFYPMVQVFLGKVLLTDFSALYGLFPHFLAPVFKVIGLDGLRFTIVLGVLAAFSFFLLYRFLLQLCSHRWVAHLGFGACLYFCYFGVKNHIADSGDFRKLTEGLLMDPYFAYWPLRILFPSLLMAFSNFYFKRPSRVAYWGGFFGFALGILWNLDAGVVVFFTWFLLLEFSELMQLKLPNLFLRLLKHAGAAALSLGLAWGAYSCCIYLFYHQLPSLALLGGNQVLYYGLGYFMLPMKVWGFWNVIVLAYLIGFVICFQGFLSQKISPRLIAVFVLSILGSGLFSYYQGRSHEYVLPSPSWPAFILWALYLDSLYDYLTKRILGEKGIQRYFSLPVGLFLFLFIFLLNYSLSLVTDTYLPFQSIRSRLARVVTQAKGDWLSRNLEFIEKHQPYPPRILVLSWYASSHYHLASNTQFIVHDSLEEVVTLAQYEEIKEVLRSRSSEKVLVDHEFREKTLERPAVKEIYQTLVENYTEVAKNDENTISLYLPKR